jgi:hypothetical protein
MDYLTKHGPHCECAPGKPRYPTLCELLAVLAQEKREAQGEIDRLTARWEALREAAGNYRLSPTCSRNWAFDNMIRLEQEP